MFKENQTSSSMPTRKQLECRIIITHREPDRYLRSVEVGMYDPLNVRYEKLGVHPRSDLERVVRDLARSIQQAGHLLTWCERTEIR